MFSRPREPIAAGIGSCANGLPATMLIIRLSADNGTIRQRSARNCGSRIRLGRPQGQLPIATEASSSQPRLAGAPAHCDGWPLISTDRPSTHVTHQRLLRIASGSEPSACRNGSIGSTLSWGRRPRRQGCTLTSDGWRRHRCTLFDDVLLLALWRCGRPVYPGRNARK